MTTNLRAKAICAILSAFVALPAAANPKETYDPAQFSELAIEAQLSPIIADLKRTLRDPRSIVDFTICPPQQIKYKNGQPVNWGVNFAFNAKNGFGAYEGLTTYVAAFRNRRLYVVGKTQLAGNVGFDGLINDIIARRLATCPTVPSERIVVMIEGSGTVARLVPASRAAPTVASEPKP